MCVLLGKSSLDMFSLSESPPIGVRGAGRWDQREIKLEIVRETGTLKKKMVGK